MVTSKYAAQIEKVRVKLAAKGQFIVLRQVIVDDFDKITDAPGDTTKKQATVAALVTPPNTMTEQSYADQFKTGQMIRSRTRSVFFATRDKDGKDLAFVPVEGDQLDVEGFTWTFVGVASFAPDGVPIYYTGTVKR